MDDSLEDEIGEECSKHGPVSQIAIFEATEPGFPPDRAVRIFVRFERAESAMKAVIALEGRFFGGRTVKATFFSEEKFERQELAPIPGEPDWNLTETWDYLCKSYGIIHRAAEAV